jgi:hypothetical protein
MEKFASKILQNRVVTIFLVKTAGNKLENRKLSDKKAPVELQSIIQSISRVIKSPTELKMQPTIDLQN